MLITGRKTRRRLWFGLAISLVGVAASIFMINVSIFAEDWNGRNPRFMVTIFGFLGIWAALTIANTCAKQYRAAPDNIEIEVTDQTVRIGDDSISVNSNAEIGIDIRASSIKAKRFSIFVFRDGAQVLENHGNFIHTISALDFAKAMPNNIQVKLYTPYEREIANYT